MPEGTAIITVRFSDGTKGTVVVDEMTAEDILTSIERMTGIRVELIPS